MQINSQQYLNRIVQRSTFKKKSGPVNNGLLNGLTAYYPLNESSGPAIDSSVNGFNMAANGSPGSAVISSGPTNLAKCRTFDGSSTYFSVTQNAFHPLGSPFTACLWYNQSANTNNFPALLGNTTLFSSEWGIGLNNTGPLAIAANVSPDGSTSVNSTWGSAPVNGNWYFVVAQWDGTNIKISLNNGAFVSTPFTGPVGNALGTPTYIGLLGGSSQIFNGNIAGVGMWIGRVLNSTDMTTLFNNGNGFPYNLWTS